MAIIANMDIVLGAKTQKLDTSLTQASGSVNRFALDIGTIAQQSDTVSEALAHMAGEWAQSIPIISNAGAVFRTVLATVHSIMNAKSARLAAEAAVTAEQFKKVSTETAQIAVTTPIIVAETRMLANEAEHYAKSLLIAAITLNRVEQLRIGKKSAGGMTLFNPKTAAAGARGAARDVADVIDAEFTFKSSAAIADAAGSVPAAAARAGSMLGGVSAGAVAAGAAVAAAFVAVGVAVAGAAVVIGGVREQMTAIDEVSDSAKRLGMSFSDLASLRLGLGQSSGLDQGAIDSSLQRMQLGLAEAKSGSGELATTLKALGLDAGQLLNMGPVAALQKISAATANLKSPTDQLQVAYQLFGKQGAALVTALRDGPGAIEQSVKAAKDLGLTLSDAQAEQVGAANDTWEQVYLIASGIFRQIAAEVAPVIQVIGQEILAVGGHFGSFSEYLPKIVDGAVMFVGYLYDANELLKIMATTLDNITSLQWSEVGKDIQSALTFDTADKMLEKVNAARAAAKDAAAKPATGDVDLALFEQQQEAQKKATDAATAAANAQKAAAERVQESIRNRIQSLKDEVDVLRLGEQAARAMQLARDGANATQIAEIQQLEAQKKAINDRNELMKKGEQVKATFATPMEKLKSEITDLEKLLKGGAIDQKTFDLAAMDAAKKLPQPEAPKPPPTIAAVEKGSVEAFSASRRNDQSSKDAKNMENIGKQQIKLLEGVIAAIKGQVRPATVGA